MESQRNKKQFAKHKSAEKDALGANNKRIVKPTTMKWNTQEK